MSWILKIVLGFFIKKIAKYAGKFDVDQAMAAWGPWISKVVPGSVFDEEAVYILDKLAHVVASVLKSVDVLKQIVELVEAKDLKGAIALLKQKVLEVLVPGGHDLALSEDDAIVMALKSA